MRASLHKAERAPGTDQQQPQTKCANYYRITHPITHGNHSPTYHHGAAKHGRPSLRELLPLLGHDLQQSFAPCRQFCCWVAGFPWFCRRAFAIFATPLQAGCKELWLRRVAHDEYPPKYRCDHDKCCGQGNHRREPVRIPERQNDKHRGQHGGYADAEKCCEHKQREPCQAKPLLLNLGRQQFEPRLYNVEKDPSRFCSARSRSPTMPTGASPSGGVTSGGLSARR